jgi:heme exporter protein C
LRNEARPPLARPGPALALGAVVLLLAGIALALFWVPEDADQGFSQKIFYIHVPVALTAYACFGFGAWKALRLLWKGDERYDLESYTAIHIGVMFGILTLATGSIWAKISWGIWWTWSERQLVVFLILFLFYSAYFMLRFSIDPGLRRSRTSAVYALLGVVLIPISFLAIRILGTILHPAVFTREGPQMSGSMFGVFLIALFGMLALAFALYQTELAGKRLDQRLRELRRALA